MIMGRMGGMGDMPGPDAEREMRRAWLWGLLVAVAGLCFAVATLLG